MILPAPFAVAASSLPQPSQRQESMADILEASFQLNGAKAMLEAMQDTLAVLTELLQDTAGVLAELGTIEAGEARQLAQLRRHDALRRQALGLLTALWHQDRGLAHATGQEAPGASSLPMLNGLPAQLMAIDPARPGVAEAALRPGGRFAQVLQAVADAQDSVDSDCRYITAQLAFNQEKIGLWEDDAGIGAFEDTDLSKEAARLRALEVRQQLAGYTLGLREHAPRCLTELLAGPGH
jgi:hypothetical protein